MHVFVSQTFRFVGDWYQTGTVSVTRHLLRALILDLPRLDMRIQIEAEDSSLQIPEIWES